MAAAAAVQPVFQPFLPAVICLTAEGAPGFQAVVLMVVALALAPGKGRTRARELGRKRARKVCEGREGVRCVRWEIEGLLRDWG